MPDKPGKRIRFGPFEADLAAAELRKDGLPIRLQDQPFQILAALLERPSEIVTREELRERLWAGHTFVDFDQGLNTAINKLREALGDSPANPRFVETLPKRGYRFHHPVEKAQEISASPDGTWLGRGVRFWAVVAVISGLLVAGFAVLWPTRPVRESALPLRRFSIRPPAQLPSLPDANSFSAISPNGRQIAFCGVQGHKMLWIQDLDQSLPKLIEGRRPWAKLVSRQ